MSALNSPIFHYIGTIFCSKNDASGTPDLKASSHDSKSKHAFMTLFACNCLMMHLYIIVYLMHWVGDGSKWESRFVSVQNRDSCSAVIYRYILVLDLSMRVSISWYWYFFICRNRHANIHSEWIGLWVFRGAKWNIVGETGSGSTRQLRAVGPYSYRATVFGLFIM